MWSHSKVLGVRTSEFGGTRLAVREPISGYVWMGKSALAGCAQGEPLCLSPIRAPRDGWWP